jgi:hypothetical protein
VQKRLKVDGAPAGAHWPVHGVIFRPDLLTDLDRRVIVMDKAFFLEGTFTPAVRSAPSPRLQEKSRIVHEPFREEMAADPS